MRIAIDTGGTFTDIVYFAGGRLAVLKLFSTPDDPGRSVLEGLQRIAPGADVVVRHGTTVATNTMLERTGARVAFVTTRGFEDMIAIGRQARPKLYDWFQPAPDCLVPAELRFGVAERVSADGETLLAVDRDDLAEVCERIARADVGAVAVSLLFSFANPANERVVAAALQKLGVPLSISHRLLPEFREFERASTVVANAYVAPRVGSYIAGLEAGIAGEYAQGRLEVMQSSGGIIPARVAVDEPVRTMLSGPAGGVMGAYRLAMQAGIRKIIGFDMGGTSTDVCLVDADAGGPSLRSESVLTGIPIGVPMLDIHTVGAGGGSIARFDAGGLLRVGPQSAGSDPGPICFGRGTRPTVTDANLALGRLDTDRFLGGSVRLDRERTMRILEQARGELETIEAFAAGIVRVVETSMEKAIRVISVERGCDPRDFTLVAFGGGGPLHACSLARAMQVPRVMVPVLPGALSAVGILLADTVREYSRTLMTGADAALDAPFAELEALGFSEFERDGLAGEALRSVDMRYRGQGYELNVPHGAEMAAHFHSLHQRRYGFAAEDRPLEIVTIRLRMVAVSESFELPRRELRAGDGAQAVVGTRSVYFDDVPLQTRLYDREALLPGDRFQGPAIISEYSSATLLPPGDELFVDGVGNLLIEVGA
jgi:N-methylhydantoinase A